MATKCSLKRQGTFYPEQAPPQKRSRLEFSINTVADDAIVAIAKFLQQSQYMKLAHTSKYLRKLLVNDRIYLVHLHLKQNQYPTYRVGEAKEEAIRLADTDTPDMTEAYGFEQQEENRKQVRFPWTEKVTMNLSGANGNRKILVPNMNKLALEIDSWFDRHALSKFTEKYMMHLPRLRQLQISVHSHAFICEIDLAK